jgi:hypothetical protein
LVGKGCAEVSASLFTISELATTSNYARRGATGYESATGTGTVHVPTGAIVVFNSTSNSLIVLKG